MKEGPPPLEVIEANLRKRLAYPYRWHRRQDNRHDAATDFIYATVEFEVLMARIEERFKAGPDFLAWRDYALNRWYNYWSARGVEMIFAQMPGVVPHRDPRDRLVDFTLRGIPFDHKTTVFPRGFGHDLAYARRHPRELLRWLYARQSRERRHHLGNRLFLVLYRADGEHWRLRAELSWLAQHIRAYVQRFDPGRLYAFSLSPPQRTLADLIWAIRS